MTIEPPFFDRLQSLPRLGVGISTEYGAGEKGLDPMVLASAPEPLISFLEIGADLARGIDADAEAWQRSGRPTTYHFLDVNLEQIEDLDADWLAATAALARRVGAAWLCGDAGVWHVGPRDRGHGTLLPPILETESAEDMAAAIRRMRQATGFEVLPENPPAQVYIGRLSLLDYFKRVMIAADCGMLLDVAHLAIYQRAMGRTATAGLEDFPCERIVEMHIAGGTLFEHEGRHYVDDDHSLNILPETWEIYEYVLQRATNLRAIVLEAERNTIAGVRPLFERLNRDFPKQLEVR